MDAADLATLRDLHAFASRLMVETSLVTGRELRMLEPALAPGLPGGLHAPGDHQVDPQLLRAALVEAGHRTGVRTVVASVTALRKDGGQVVGVDLDDGSSLDADTVVLAAGAWSAPIGGAAVRPVKGQTLRLRLPGPPRLTHVLRGRVKGSPVYLVPRADAGSSSAPAPRRPASTGRRGPGGLRTAA